MRDERGTSTSTETLQPSDIVEIFDLRLEGVDSYPFEVPGDRFVSGGSGELARDAQSGAPLIRLQDRDGGEDIIISYDKQGKFLPKETESYAADRIAKRSGDFLLRRCDPRPT